MALQPQLAMMLFIGSRTDREALENKNLVMQSRQLLRFCAKSFDHLRLALLRVDSVWWRGLQETIHLSPQVERALQETDATLSSRALTTHSGVGGQF